jgi:myo-inositol-1(or 4)-monophosphatase
MHPLLNIAIRAARNAGNVILRSLPHIEGLTIEEKGKNDYVSEVDRLAEQEIINTIKKAYPDHAILAEESGEQGDSDTVWVIDPLDGTANFLHGFPQYAVSIAVIVKGKIEHGVVYDPRRDELFSASRGQGAKLNDQRIRVSNNRHLEKTIIATGFPFRFPELQEAYFKSFHAVFSSVSDIRRPGSASLDLAYVAAGRVDGYWEIALSSWDVAAGMLLVEEAGGIVSDCEGNDSSLKTGNILVGNPYVHKQLEKIIRPHLTGVKK